LPALRFNGFLRRYDGVRLCGTQGLQVSGIARKSGLREHHRKTETQKKGTNVTVGHSAINYFVGLKLSNVNLIKSNTGYYGGKPGIYRIARMGFAREVRVGFERGSAWLGGCRLG
jgi:hypothetical protein